MAYPVFILAYNQLTTLRNLIEQVARLDDVGQITISDHASTYPPLLAWYDAACPGLDAGVKIVRKPYNMGPLTAWKDGSLSDDFHVVTDCDLDISGAPRNLLRVLRSGLNEYPDVKKVGLSLEIDDLPDTEIGRMARDREAKYWEKRRNAQFWEAPIDTTFAMYRPGERWSGYGPALRTDRPYVARHLPWYWQTLTDEQRYNANQKQLNVTYTTRLKR